MNTRIIHFNGNLLLLVFVVLFISQDLKSEAGMLSTLYEKSDIVVSGRILDSDFGVIENHIAEFPISVQIEEIYKLNSSARLTQDVIPGQKIKILFKYFYLNEASYTLSFPDDGKLYVYFLVKNGGWFSKTDLWFGMLDTNSDLEYRLNILSDTNLGESIPEHANSVDALSKQELLVDPFEKSGSLNEK